MASWADRIECLFFVVAGLGVGAFTAFMTYFQLSGPSGEPQCGQCGYLAKGAASFTCPECGSDLRDVGIVRRRQSHVPFVIATCAGLTLAGAIIVVGGWLSL